MNEKTEVTHAVRAYTYFYKSHSERTPHHSVDDRIDARIATCEYGQPAEQADVRQIVQTSGDQQVPHMCRGPAQGEYGGDLQTREDETS